MCMCLKKRETEEGRGLSKIVHENYFYHRCFTLFKEENFLLYVLHDYKSFEQMTLEFSFLF